jgi:hypothetical protein
MIENIVVSGAIIMKGPAGVLIPLGIEMFVSGAATTYLYNLLAVSIILFVAAMSGPRSEAAFCIVVPIFAGITELFGWLRMSTSTGQAGLIALTVIMGIFGVFMYMSDQNKQLYGTYGPGSKLFNVAFYLLFFSAALTLISGFSVFPIGATQPINGTCAAGFTCDAFNNIDFSSSIGSISHSGGLGQSVISAVVAIPAAGLAALILILNLVVGVLVFPVVLNSTLNGIFPGISSVAGYIVFLGVMELVILLIYAQGFFNLLWKPVTGDSL